MRLALAAAQRVLIGGVKIHFQADFRSGRHYSALLEWISL